MVVNNKLWCIGGLANILTMILIGLSCLTLAQISLNVTCQAGCLMPGRAAHYINVLVCVLAVERASCVLLDLFAFRVARVMGAREVQTRATDQ